MGCSKSNEDCTFWNLKEGAVQSLGILFSTEILSCVSTVLGH